MSERQRIAGRLLVAIALVVPLLPFAPVAADEDRPRIGVGPLADWQASPGFWTWCPENHPILEDDCIVDTGILTIARPDPNVAAWDFALLGGLGDAIGSFTPSGGFGTARLLDQFYVLLWAGGSLPNTLGLCSLSLSFSGPGVGDQEIGAGGTANPSLCTN